MWRQRIRITLSGSHAHDDPVELNDHKLTYPEHRFWEHVKENEQVHQAANPEDCVRRVLPVCALNEVFVGESLSAR